MKRETATIEQLLDIMRKLRDPETGCDWDIRQNFRSIAPFTVEEAYEVADAIERDDLEDLCDELGDLLFQVVFHAQMASEIGAFTFSDVTQAIIDKMLRRHPHVFDDVVYASEAELKTGWEAIKAEERRLKAERRNRRQSPLQPVADSAGRVGKSGTGASPPGDREGSAHIAARPGKSGDGEPASAPESAAAAGSDDNDCITTSTVDSPPASALDDIPGNLPALRRADKLQRRAARTGFDWPQVSPVWDKLEEEIVELREALIAGNKDAIEDEFGDLLFTVVNIARHCAVDAEQALQRASGKFGSRFRRVEQLAAAEGMTLQNLTLEHLDDLWQQAKQKPMNQAND